jgi:hypothetical protein
LSFIEFNCIPTDIRLIQHVAKNAWMLAGDVLENQKFHVEVPYETPPQLLTTFQQSSV